MRSDRDTCVFRWPSVRHDTFSILCAAVLLLALSCDASAQLQIKADVAADESKTAGDAEADQDSAQSKEVVDQINSIRRQMGGGVASQLEGLFDDSEDGRQQLEREFKRRLNDLVATPRPAPAVQPAPLDGAMDRVGASLRTAARQLDSVAADLEDVGLYTEADMIRTNAANLRSRARSVAPGWVTKAAQTGRSGSSRLPVAERSGALSGSSGLPTSALDPKIRPRQ